ncbi:MAG: PAS-domain containing protein [Acidobacteria bacterium]|nr:PAS-domain containing protein [Acidobacteriota bacterium]
MTDRLALERSYNTLTEVQRETLDHLFEGIAVFGSDGRLKLHNPAYRQIWGLSEVDLAGEPHFSEVVDKTRAYYDDGGNWPTLRDRLIARITAQAHWSGQLDRQDGAVLSLATVPLPDGNVLFTCLDVTDTTRVERALRERNEALETAGRLKSEFIANVSYELRTPLNAIIGFSDLLTEQEETITREKRLNFLENVGNSARHLLTLISDLLDIAKVESGKMKLHRQPIDLRHAILNTVASTQPLFVRRKQQVEVVTPPEPMLASADESRIEQVLLNLLSNANKFSPEGDRIVVRGLADETMWRIEVADHGIGISPEDQSRIFGEFEQVHSVAHHSGGTGLGLALAKKFVEAHGGTIGVESVAGRGSVFWVRVPREKS